MSQAGAQRMTQSRSSSAINFSPTETPLGVPTLTDFQVRDRVYVVDMNGNLFRLDTASDDPDMWNWQFMQEL
jgi:Tfp pilus tip-associated adhesin PilY1